LPIQRRARAAPIRFAELQRLKAKRAIAFDEFRAGLPPRGALLGLDVGTKTVGLALSDRTRTVASALKTLRRRRFAEDAEAILAIAAAREVVGIVVGLPVEMSGREGPRAQSCRAFARNLASLTDLPVTFWDERLSTAAAERVLIEADASRKRRAEVVDAVAAAYILQGALDRMRSP
jgi:putative Holliday junction resolvase